MSWEARYPGACDVCREYYPEGTRIERVPDTHTSLKARYQHAGGCPDVTGDPPDIHPVCPRCWLVHPPGDCDR